MPSCAATARGMRAKTTFTGVMAFPNWRFIAQYIRRRNGLRGDSIGWMRMIVISFCRDGCGRVRVLHAPAVVCERQRAEERAERDAAGDRDGLPHTALRRAANVVAMRR